MTRLIVALWLALLALCAGAQELQPVPPLSARVIDQTGTLSAAQRDALEAKLAAFERVAGPQMVVVIVATIFLVPCLGPLGAAIATLAGTSSDAVVRLWILRQAMREHSSAEGRAA